MIHALLFPVLSLAALVAHDARVFTPREGAKMTAGYGTLTNDGKEPVTIILQGMEGFGSAEMHESFEKDGHAAMRRLPEVKLAAGASVDFHPGGNHLMLFDPRAGLKKGDTLEATFLVNGKAQKVKFKVAPREEGGAMKMKM